MRLFKYINHPSYLRFLNKFIEMNKWLKFYFLLRDSVNQQWPLKLISNLLSLNNGNHKCDVVWIKIQLDSEAKRIQTKEMNKHGHSISCVCVL